MPVTAKLSRKFYDKLGDDVANELVDWFNTVDLTYRQEFRELFETSFSRIEARLAQVSAELRSEIAQSAAATEKTLIRWMFLFWIGSWAAIAGILVALRQLGWLSAP